MPFLQFLYQHLFLISIGLIVLGMIGILIVGIPFCHKALLVSQAHTKDGIERLAKYMAKRSCHSPRTSHDLWRTFIPAAKIVGNIHSQKRYDYTVAKNNQPKF